MSANGIMMSSLSRGFSSDGRSCEAWAQTRSLSRHAYGASNDLGDMPPLGFFVQLGINDGCMAMFASFGIIPSTGTMAGGFRHRHGLVASGTADGGYWHWHGLELHARLLVVTGKGILVHAFGTSSLQAEQGSSSLILALVCTPVHRILLQFGRLLVQVAAFIIS